MAIRTPENTKAVALHSLISIIGAGVAMFDEDSGASALGVLVDSADADDYEDLTEFATYVADMAPASLYREWSPRHVAARRVPCTVKGLSAYKDDTATMQDVLRPGAKHWTFNTSSHMYTTALHSAICHHALTALDHLALLPQPNGEHCSCRRLASHRPC